jgi:hypothetical protein
VRDLESLVVATSSDGEGRNAPSLALSKGAVAATYQGVNLFLNKGHGKTVAFGFPDTGLAVMGDLASIHQVIQNLKAPANLDVDLMNRIEAVGSANDAWFVSAVGGAALGKHFAAETNGQFNGQAQALQSIRAANGGVRFGSQVAVSMDAATRSPQDAASLADVFRFMASMVQMQRQKDPRAGIVAASLDNMQLQTNGDSVHLAFTMSEKNLEQIADLGAQGKR